MSYPQVQLTERERVEMTCRCNDAAGIPKVDDAGTVFHTDGMRLQRMHNGLKVVADGYYGAWMTEIIARLKGHHEPQEERVFHEVLRRIPAQASMLEIGGFWLYYSLWFLQAHPTTRRAYAIEPDPHHIAIGRQNASLNGLHVDIQQGFVGGHGPSPTTFHTETAGPLEMPRINVPALLRERGLEELTILHCDAQGAEVDVLKDCEPLFRDGLVKFVFVSTHAAAISGDPLTHQRCLVLLRDLGAAVIAEHDVHESFSGDGLIAAYFGRDHAGGAPVELSYNRYSHSLFRNPLYDQAALAAEVAALRERLATASRSPISRLFKRYCSGPMKS